MNNFAYPNEAEDDLEALNTDVFRFLSIIGLILAILFSLVQSIPDNPKQSAPQLDNINLLQSDIVHLQQQVEQLKQSLAKAESTHAKVGSLQQALAQSKHELEKLEAQSRLKDAQLSKLRKQVAKEQRKVHKLQRRVSPPPAPQPAAKKTVKPSVPQPKAAPKTTQKTKRQGFTLGFASDVAFMQLFKSRQIKLYLLKNKQVWLVTASGRLAPTQVPLNLYHLSGSTLPKGVLNSLAKNATLSGNEQFTVGLSKATSTQIQQVMKNHKAGNIVITSAGKVDIF